MPTSLAIVHEWLASYAGSERVVEQLLHLYPDADLFALANFLPEKDRQWLGAHEPHTSFIQRLPLAKRFFRHYLPLFPLAIEQFDLTPYDVVLSSNHAVAKGVVTRADQLHISYVHTPIRYAWDLQHQYLRETKLTWGLRSILVRGILHYLRLWDRAAADRVDLFVANSRYIAQRIWKTYRRPAEVIYPPVDVDQYALSTTRDDFYLTASRLVPYKKVDLIVEAFRKMPGRKLVVIGDGPDYKKISARPAPNVQLLGYQEGAALRQHMQTAKAFVFAADEDFGITPVEAQACGTPVIAFGKGGALETVIEGETGTFFARQEPEHLIAAVEKFEADTTRFDPHRIRAHAERFSVARFRQAFAELVERERDRFQRGQQLGAGDQDVAAGRQKAN